MKIILLILFLSFSSFSVADDHSMEWKILAEANSKEWETSKELHEKLCEIMSQDISDLYMLRQNHWSLVKVLGEARQRNKELSKKLFGDDGVSDVMEGNWLDYYETSVLNIFESFSVTDDPEIKYRNASIIRDREFADCYRKLVLEK